ncbi:MAG TPA: beta-ketoacyl synthase N-terminal-like domain-containing protein, partial [Kofleriaceae bacterium]|nr:beta-ketoacyl synthase N-terminal-like domain-containing protein [Kofleriaceae bacterium]
AHDLARDAEPVEPRPIPWPGRAGAASRLHRPARDLRADLVGHARIAALVRRALAECGARSDTQLVLASCNGGAISWDAADWRASFALDLSDTPWQGTRPPVVSAACASGLHALYLARALVAAGARDAVAVAVDVDTPPSRDNFESLRVLADQPAPFQPEASGFQVGEAAIAVRIARGDGPRLSSVELGHDLDGDDGGDGDGLRRSLAALGPLAPDLIIGQGSGPASTDRAELAALASRIARTVPLTTPAWHFGHTLGASSLLAVALAATAVHRSIPRLLALPDAAGQDGRPLVTGAASASEVVVGCRALGGACGACVVGGPPRARAPRDTTWRASALAPPLRDPVLRALAAAAPAARPGVPPELLIVTLDAPLVPAAAARIGERLLPSSVLEMTPGFVARLIAQAWGFAGPAICLVGDATSLVAACRRVCERVFVLAIRGTGEHRDVEWNA